jgi:hypothetical protein
MKVILKEFVCRRMELKRKNAIKCRPVVIESHVSDLPEHGSEGVNAQHVKGH